MLRGLAVPLVTPFRTNGTVCIKSVAALLRHVAPHVSVVVPCLTTGEGWILSEAQWQDMIVTCLKQLGPSRVIAGIEVPTSAEAVARANLAVTLGCESVIATKPFGADVTQAAILKHYASLTLGGALSVYAYNESWLSDNRLTDSSLLALSAIPGIAGIKESTASLARTAWLLDHKELLPPIYQGREEHLAASAAFDGFMIALANLQPSLCAVTFRAPTKTAHAKLRDLCVENGLWTDEWIRRIKVELYRQGIISTPDLARPTAADQKRSDGIVQEQSPIKVAACAKGNRYA